MSAIEDIFGAGELLPGDRTVRRGEYVQEWTIGKEWVPVCDRDNVAMVGSDGGRRCCAMCGGLYPEAARRA